MAMVAALVILLIAAPGAYAADHVVGGSGGWTNFGNSDYDTWSSGQTFKVGDNLVFNYGTATHSVAEVSKSDYDSCDASNAIKTYTDGATSIPLTAAATRYFICPSAGHCSGGMKVSVKVGGGSSSGGGSPSTPTPTDSGSATPSDEPSTPSDEPSTPSSSGGSSSRKEPSSTGGYDAGAAVTSALYNVVFGSAVVVGTTMVALLG